MSTAILISGQLRTFARCWPTQRWHILRHFSDPHFFITVQKQSMDTPGYSEALQTLIDVEDKFGLGRVHTNFIEDPDLSEHLTPQLAAAYHQAPYTNAAPAHQLLLQHWYQAECWKFFQSQTISQEAAESAETNPSAFGSTSASSVPSCKKGLEKFDTIIRLRGDLWFHSFEDPFDRTITRYFDKGTEMQANGSVRMKLLCGSNECFTPWWGRFGGINDRFAIMGPEAAKSYFTVFDAIPELLAAGCPFHPESLVKANLERGNIDLHETLRTEFSTLRQNGEQRWPEITPIDMAHAALRAA